MERLFKQLSQEEFSSADEASVKAIVTESKHRKPGNNRSKGNSKTEKAKKAEQKKKQANSHEKEPITAPLIPRRKLLELTIFGKFQMGSMESGQISAIDYVRRLQT
ncbi:hypothetical protein RJ640_018187 [Escallonia rubra]|uniref:Uncharacterized protein n=1 Tax=Escallonia rubra TaxID=112253 RepID=A0AA88RPA8_9ASTE|nr:hypothetical protein RJ640_018187 [Escallonia rubra]